MNITFDSEGAYIAIHYGGGTDIAIGQGCTILSTIATPMTPSDVAAQHTGFITSLDLGILHQLHHSPTVGGSLDPCK
jgi:hypothetical protein